MRRILVIDDDPETRALLEQMLKPAGYEVALAMDGLDGVRKYKECPAAVVLTDLYMPNQEGLETIIQLRRDFPTVPIIAMSGKIAAGTMLSIALKVGAIDILQKPFLREELLGAIENALRWETIFP